jgi:thiamine biosynthesis lipoprotein
MPGLERRADYFVGHFDAMASRCEVLIDTRSEGLAQNITQIVATEVKRIEQKYSRYRDDSIVHRINSGVAVEVDEETTRLLDYAQQLYQLSDGLFDITSGVLRRVWTFDGSDNLPSPEEVEALLPLIGWNKVKWQAPIIQLPEAMEIDLGGIGKEYAADRAALCVTTFLSEQTSEGDRNTSVLINLGGDLAVTGPRANGEGWRVGVAPDSQSSQEKAADFALKQGGVATSGDANRFLEKDGVRYSHVLNPRTGWPVVGAPRAITVAAATCTDAGMLSTMALLQGDAAETFLKEQDAPYWCQW